jgi:hypothetical protein
MQHHVPGVFHAEEHCENEHEAEDVHQQPLQRRRRHSIAIQVSQDEKQRADLNAKNAEHQQRMRRRNDLHIKPVGLMPPVVEGRRRQHRNAAPGRNESPQRSAKTEDANRASGHFRGGRESGAQDQVTARNPGENAAQVNSHVRRRPKRVAADGPVPGDIPVSANGHRRDSERGAPNIPGNGTRFRIREGSRMGGGAERGHW